MGELACEAGNIFRPKDYRIGYLPQEELIFSSNSILDAVLEGNKEILEIEQKMVSLQHELAEKTKNKNHDDLLKRLGNYEQRYEILGGYRVEAEAKAVLTGLGFSTKSFHSTLSQFSGGWRMRVYLARILIQSPDLLLLDEPTNHLDLPSLEWLEQYLLNFDGSIVFVSHDRFFIDRLAQEIYELDRGKVTRYPGNYHFYERQKEEKLVLLQKQWEEQRTEKERQQKFIDRFRYKATKARQVQSRVKQLNKLSDIEIPLPAPQFSFKLAAEIQSYKEVVHIHDMSFRYDEGWVLRDVNLNIYRGDRVALVGGNGAGKTTLTRLIVGQLSPVEGEVRLGKRVQIGYYAQHQVETLNLNNTIYEEIEAAAPLQHIHQIRNILGIFRFGGDEVHKKIVVLSGGEKARVSLAKILLSQVNFLIMDEPTNHLDIISKEALETALSGFDGTLLLISHDRYFLDKLVKRVVEIKDHQLNQFEGNYSDYLRLREIKSEAIFEKPATEAVKKDSKKSKEKKRREAEARQTISKLRSQLQREIETVEAEIEKLEQRKSELEKILADPRTYKTSMFAISSQAEYVQVKKDLENSVDKWEKNHVELESLLRSIQ